MSETPAAYIAFTAPVNPASAEPALTRAQVWQGLHRKVRHAEEFVGGAIKSTDVISQSKDDHGREVVTREVVFSEGDRRVKEVCTVYPDVKVEFLQSGGSRILNIISDSADGQIYMTFQFEWMMEKGTSVESQREKTQMWKKLSQRAVESTIKALREMIQDGRIKT